MYNKDIPNKRKQMMGGKKKRMSKLLLNEEPLLIMPQLACKVGLNESIVLQQIHYWNQHNKKFGNNFKDGYYWTFNSYPRWQEQFPFWSIPTIQRVFIKLEEKKLIVSANYNKYNNDRTKWYRIDYNELEKISSSDYEAKGSSPYQNDMTIISDCNYPSHQNDMTNISSCDDHDINLIRPIPETNSETPTKINPESYTFQEILSLYNTYIKPLTEPQSIKKLEDMYLQCSGSEILIQAITQASDEKILNLGYVLMLSLKKIET